MKAAEISERILGLLPDAKVVPEGEECNFSVLVISASFAGQNPLQRQRPILALFREEIASGALHALSIKARTPEEEAAS